MKRRDWRRRKANAHPGRGLLLAGLAVLLAEFAGLIVAAVAGANGVHLAVAFVIVVATAIATFLICWGLYEEDFSS